MKLAHALELKVKQFGERLACRALKAKEFKRIEHGLAWLVSKDKFS